MGTFALRYRNHHRFGNNNFLPNSLGIPAAFPVSLLLLNLGVHDFLSLALLCSLGAGSGHASSSAKWDAARAGGLLVAGRHFERSSHCSGTIYRFRVGDFSPLT